jgi:hypothetical protein
MNFTRQQQEAIEAVGENVIVSAGAGSGKTAVSDRSSHLSHQREGFYVGSVHHPDLHPLSRRGNEGANPQGAH